jgi:hypothetical protein
LGEEGRRKGRGLGAHAVLSSAIAELITSSSTPWRPKALQQRIEAGNRLKAL